MTFPESLLAEIIVTWRIGQFMGFAAGRYKQEG